LDCNNKMKTQKIGKFKSILTNVHQMKFRSRYNIIKASLLRVKELIQIY
jgi:hypothetical protein